MPPKEVLKALRTAIFYHPEELRDILADEGFSRYFRDLEGEKLKKLPAGFPADFAYPELLRPKSFAVGLTISDEQFLGKELIPFTLEVFREVAKLNRFLNEALDQYL